MAHRTAPLCALLLLLAACAGTDRAASVDEAVRDDRPPLGELVELFVAEPNTLLGGEIAEAMGSSGDPAWVPWLVDLLRLGRSTALDEQATDALAALTPVEPTHERVRDLVAFGGWMYDEAIDPGPGYAAWKIGIYERIDGEYRRLLGAVDDPVELTRIQFGGVPRGGIPELNDPARLPVADADHMIDDEIVHGTELGGREVAYPFRIMGHHELANDVVGDRPVVMALCTLCRTATLFDRRVDGQVLDFETSGLLLNSNKVMVDRQTDTLWNQITGEAFAGPLAGATLTGLPIVTTRWSSWVADHPDSEVLDLPEPIFFDEPERPPIAYDYDPDVPQSSYYASDDVWFPIFDTPDVFPLKSEVVTVDAGGSTLAVELTALADHGPLVVDVGDHPVLVVPTAAGARVFDAGGAGLPPGAVTLAGTTAEAATLEDGRELPRLLSGQSFWFAWYGQHPDTAWWPEA